MPTRKAALYVFWLAVRNVDEATKDKNLFDRMFKWQKTVRTRLGYRFSRMTEEEMIDNIVGVLTKHGIVVVADDELDDMGAKF